MTAIIAICSSFRIFFVSLSPASCVSLFVFLRLGGRGVGSRIMMVEGWRGGGVGGAEEG